MTPGLFLCDYCNSLSEEDRDKREKWISFYFEQVPGGIGKYNGGDKCDLRVAHFWLADMAQFKLALKPRGKGCGDDFFQGEKEEAGKVR